MGRPKVYENTLADTESDTLDVNTDLGRNGGNGYIINDGDGDLLIRISNDGTNYSGGSATGSTEEAKLKKDEILRLGGVPINKIIIKASGAASYRGQII